MTARTAWIDLHSSFAIELIDVPPHLAARLSARLGAGVLAGTPDREPAMRIVAEPAWSTAGAMLVGGFAVDRNSLTAFTPSGRPAIRFDPSLTAAPIEIRVAADARDVPLLSELINARLLEGGVLPLHAASCILDGIGVAVVGWSGGGKTEALLRLMREGAQALGDEWTLVGPQPRAMTGISSPMRLTDRQVSSAVRGVAQPGRATRIRMGAAAVAELASRSVARTRAPFVASVASRIVPRLHGLRRVWVTLDTRQRPPATQLDRLFIVRRHEAADLRVRELALGDVIEPTVMAHEQHRTALMAAYRAFRYVVQATGPVLLDDTAIRERSLVEEMLAGVRAWEVLLPTAPSAATDFGPLLRAATAR
jgi:hypothetical protein